MLQKIQNSVLVFILMFLSVAVTEAANYYVNDAALTGDIFCSAAGNNANNGTSSATPKLTLANLLSTYSGTLGSGDIIYIDAGTYNESNIDFAIAGVTFAGAGANITIIDHNWAGMNSDFFMYIHANNISLKNMTLQKFENQGTQTPGRSGQVLTIKNATGVLIENVVMSQNGESGGNPSISIQENSTVSIRGGGGLCNRWQTQFTGGIEVYGASITLNIENYVFAYNFKTGAYDGGGLLIHNANASTTIVNIKNCSFYNNEASDGGGISQRGGILNVSDCIFQNNMAGQISTPIYGGAVRITGGTATFKRCRFISNQVGSAGGTLRGAALGIFSLDANVDLTIDSCYFSGNTGAEGDDLYADKSFAKTINIHATNTTFSASADAIFNKDADHIHLLNCGNPSVSGSNSPAVYKENTTAPTYTANPIVPGFTGDCATGIVLPIVLEFFSGKCQPNGVVLQWQTASEINNRYFQVERSADGLSYIPITIILGNGTINSTSAYHYVDPFPQNTTQYYRLVQYDFDGKHYEYEPISVSYPCLTYQNNPITAYASEHGNLIVFTIASYSPEEYGLTLTDITGKIIHQERVMFSDALSHTITIPAISGGIYLYRFLSGSEIISGKVLIEKQ